MEKVVSRGYVKWTDEDGVFHKEPLYKHEDMLAKASPAEKLAAEEVRRLNAAAEEFYADRDEDVNEDLLDTLDALKEAPEDIHTAAELVAELDEAESAPLSGAEEPAAKTEDKKPVDKEHDQGLEELREETTRHRG